MNTPQQYTTTRTLLASLCSRIGAGLSITKRMAEVSRNGEIQLAEFGCRNRGPELGAVLDRSQAVPAAEKSAARAKWEGVVPMKRKCIKP